MSWGVTAVVALAALALALAVIVLLRGPRQADRVVALDIFLAAGIALCIAAALATSSTAFLDVAIGLGLVGFVGTVGWARLVERGGDVGP